MRKSECERNRQSDHGDGSQQWHFLHLYSDGKQCPRSQCALGCFELGNAVIRRYYYRNNATFVALDTTTQGNWQGVYGSNGYNVISGTVAYPSFVAVTPSGTSTTTWASSTTDVRALYTSATSTSRIAATWFNNTSFVIDLVFNDGKQHQLALYCLDWDSTQRAETVAIQDANGVLLNTQNMTNFHNGDYLVWQLSGHVRIVVTTKTTSANAVVSGLFFDTTASTTTGTATFVALDTTTQGNWQGVYGSNGYNVINGTVAYPSYVTVTPSGQSTANWTSSTTDVRALYTSATSTSRIAATWYNNTSFLIDLVFNDGQQHRVAMYCLDWDSTQRAETVAIQDANGVLLNTQNMTNFHNGDYLVWQLSGHVRIVVTTKTTSANAVVSGLFFK